MQKISSFFDYIDSRCRENVVPGVELSVDESIIKFKGGITFIAYNPQKPTKWGIRIYVLVDANIGYIQTIYHIMAVLLQRNYLDQSCQ